jgi:glycosyltransferase involved in cell wall biosynthesis
MRILCIPYEIAGVPDADVRFVPIMQALSKENVMMGVKKYQDFDNTKPLFSYLRYVGHMFKTLFFGLRHHKEIDLIIAENQVAPHALLGGIISIVIHKPCIWDSHGNMLAYCREANRSKLLTFILTLSDKLSGRIIKTMVVPSEVDKKHYREQNFRRNTILVIPSGISLGEVDAVFDSKVNLRKKLELDTGKKILIFTGRGSYVPNIEALQWMNNILAPVLGEKFPDVQILILGPWDRTIKVHPIIKFTGFVPSLYEYLHASDLCLAPVRLENGISTKVIEYMACAKPVVASQSVVNGTPQIVDGENAFLAKDGNEFISKTLYILDKPFEAEQMGAKARKVIENYYNWETLSTQWNQLIHLTAARK